MISGNCNDNTLVHMYDTCHQINCQLTHIMDLAYVLSVGYHNVGIDVRRHAQSTMILIGQLIREIVNGDMQTLLDMIEKSVEEKRRKNEEKVETECQM